MRDFTNLCLDSSLATECPTKYIVNKNISAFALLVFQLWFGFSGVLSGNQWEFMSAILIGFLLIAFAAVRLFGNLKDMAVYDVVMFVAVVLVEFGCLFILPWLLKEHKWRLYRKVGADIQLRRMYSHYLVLICLLKILLLLSIINGTSSGLNRIDQTGTIALDVMHWVSTLAFVILSYLAFRFEWRALIFIALFLGLYAPGYIGYWFYEIIVTKQLHSNDYALKALAISFVATGALTLIAQPAAMIILALQYPKFDSGFKTIFSDPYSPIHTLPDPSAAPDLYVPIPIAFVAARRHRIANVPTLSTSSLQMRTT